MRKPLKHQSTTHKCTMYMRMIYITVTCIFTKMVIFFYAYTNEYYPNLILPLHIFTMSLISLTAHYILYLFCHTFFVNPLHIANNFRLMIFFSILCKLMKLTPNVINPNLTTSKFIYTLPNFITSTFVGCI